MDENQSLGCGWRCRGSYAAAVLCGIGVGACSGSRSWVAVKQVLNRIEGGECGGSGSWVAAILWWWVTELWMTLP